MTTQTPDSDSSPRKTRQLAGLVTIIVFCVALTAGIIYFIRVKEAEKRELILRNPGYATGIITRRRTYKRRRVTVQYTVGGAVYTLRTRVPRAFLRTHKKGDTTAVIYAITDPATAILKVKLRPSTN